MGYYPKEFTLLSNFELAWHRVARGSNREYKRLFSHLYPSYRFALRTNLQDLVSEVKAGLYQPSPGTKVYFPKQTGVLRPVTLLSINDQIVYQAIANVIANRYYGTIRPLYGQRTFGALYAGRNSKFFYRQWKRCYRDFNRAITRAYSRGNRIMADFDLVSFFDLIDHKALRAVLNRRVRSGELLDLLDMCLQRWSSPDSKNLKGHGIPQGPEASAFLAAVFLSDFDKSHYGRVVYLRYVDDIKLLGKSYSAVKRALIKLDLQSKNLGLVPQAQKIAIREVDDIKAELKSVPSAVVGAQGRRRGRRITKSTIRRLERLLRRSLAGLAGRVVVKDPTRFKFALYRLPRQSRVLKRIAPLFLARPDLSGVLAHYASSFGRNAQTAAILHKALKDDPVFDAAAGEYVDVLDRCVPRPEPRKFRNLVVKLPARSQESSLLLGVPVKVYALRRMNKGTAVQQIAGDSSPISAGLVIHRLALDPMRRTIKPADISVAIRRFAAYLDADLSRYCTYLMLTELSLYPGRSSPAGRLLLKHLGVKIRGQKPSLLTDFFKQYFGLYFSLDWSRLLGPKSHSEAQRRSNQMRGLWGANPSVFITVLDSFNDLLVQRFSAMHPSLKAAHKRAAGKYKIPDFGSWLKHPSLKSVLATACTIFSACHSLRLVAEIAHPTEKKTGKHTRPITYKESEKTVKQMVQAYRELLTEWAAI